VLSQTRTAKHAVATGGEHGERHADGGAVRVADDVAEAGVTTRDPLLGELHADRQRAADGDGDERVYAGEDE